MTTDLATTLTRQEFEALDVSFWQQHSLAPYVFPRVSLAYRKGLVKQHLQAVMRWKIQEKEWSALFERWHVAGLHFIPIKGVAMALRHYPEPQQRFFGDIDVVIRPEDLQKIRQIAESQNWEVIFDAVRDGTPQNHEMLGLLSPSGHTRMDVQRSLLKHPAALEHQVEPLLNRVMQQMETVHWAGVPLTLLSPPDMALVTLVLHRAWYGEHWGLKPHDYLDLEVLKSAGMTRAALLQRAEELGVRRTTELFLSRCDPWKGVFVPALPDPATLQHWNQQVVSERGYGEFKHVPGLQRTLQALRHAPAGMMWVCKVWKDWKSTTDLEALCQRFPLTPERSAGLEVMWEMRLGIEAIFRVLTPFLKRQQKDPGLLKALSLLAALRHQGLDAELVQGVQHSPECVHHWVEYHQQVIPFQPSDHLLAYTCKEVFRSRSLEVQKPQHD